jgi:hypothetical protein
MRRRFNESEVVQQIEKLSSSRIRREYVTLDTSN